MKYFINKIIIDDKLILENETTEIKSDELTNRLDNLESQIINIALHLQSNKIGFRSLGYHIRENKALFEAINEDMNFFKATENRRSIYKLLFDWVAKDDGKVNIVFTYDPDFGRKIVDGSLISYSDIVAALENILKTCKFKKRTILYVLVVYELSNATVFKTEKHVNKQYYKLKINENI